MRIPKTIQLLGIGLILSGLTALAPAAPQPDAAEPDAVAPDAAEPDAAAADAAAPDAAASKAETLFDQGRDALFNGQYDQAVKLLSEAVAADETKTNYRLHLARAYQYAGKDKEAETTLDEILKIAPDHVEAGQALGAIYTKAKRWKDLVGVLEPLLKYRHDYPTYHMLAEAQYNLGEHEKARKHYEEAVKLNPQSATDHYQLGNIYLAGNFFALAAESYQAASRLGIDSPVLHYKLGSAYFNLRNHFGLISVRTVKSGKPGTISGDWYLIEPVPGKQDVFRCAPQNSAIYQVAKALADGIEQGPDIHVLRANIYLNARRYQQAYEMFAEIGPTVPQEDLALFHYYHARAAFGTGRYDEYLSLLEKAIELDPDAYQSTLVDAYLQVAEQYNQVGELDKYIHFLKKAVGQSPRTASLHLKLGYAYEEDQKLDLALAQWQMTLDLEPDHPDRMKLLNLIEKHRAGVVLSVGPSRPPEVAPEDPSAGEDEPAQTPAPTR